MRLKILIGVFVCLIFMFCKSNGPVFLEQPYAIPIIKYFIANPNQIMLGEASILIWDVKFSQTWKGERVEIDNGIGVVDSKGSTKVSPIETTKYKLTAYGKGCNSIREILVIVGNKEIIK